MRHATSRRSATVHFDFERSPASANSVFLGGGSPRSLDPCPPLLSAFCFLLSAFDVSPPHDPVHGRTWCSSESQIRGVVIRVRGRCAPTARPPISEPPRIATRGVVHATVPSATRTQRRNRESPSRVRNERIAEMQTKPDYQTKPSSSRTATPPQSEPPSRPQDTNAPNEPKSAASQNTARHLNWHRFLISMPTVAVELTGHTASG